MADNTDGTKHTPEPATDDISTANQRFAVTVPNPEVRLVMGVPSEAFGYNGVSVLSKTHSYWSVSGRSLFEHSGATAHVGGGTWSVFSGNDLTLSSNVQMNLASKRICIVAAGAGYGESMQSGIGDEPPVATFNNVDYIDMARPCHWGVSNFDTYDTTQKQSLKERLGYAKPNPAQAAAASSHAGALAHLTSALQGKLFGTPPPTTEHSMFVGEFLPEAHGIMGLLNATQESLDRLDRMMQRPENIPIAGPIMQKAKQAQNAVKFGGEACTELAPLGRKNTWTELGHDEATAAGAFKKDAGLARGETAPKGSNASESSEPDPTKGTLSVSPASGIVQGADVTVTLTTNEAGATIYYTTDGSAPSEDSTKYTAPFQVSGTGLVTVRAKTNMEGSVVATRHYWLAPVGAAKTNSPALSSPAGTYSAPLSVRFTCADPAALFFFTTDGSDPTTTASPSTTGPVAIAQDGTTLKVLAAAPGKTPSDVVTATYSFSGPSAVSMAPAPATFANPVVVTLSATPADAVIYYTLDGTPPSPDGSGTTTQYSSPVTVDTMGSTCLQAIAVKSGIASKATSGTYTIGQAEKSAPSDPVASAAARANAAMKLPTTDVINMIRPIRNLTRNLSQANKHISETIEAVGQFLGLFPPPPSALGLTGKHGVSLFTPDRLFGFAGSGICFVSHADTAVPDASKGALGKLVAKADPLEKAMKKGIGSHGLFGSPSPVRPPQVAAFRVLTTGDIELRASALPAVAPPAGASGALPSTPGGGHVSVLADDSVRIATGLQLDLSGMTGALVRSQSGPVELAGSVVGVGIPNVDQARKAAKDRLQAAPAEATATTTKAELATAEAKCVTTAADVRKAFRELVDATAQVQEAAGEGLTGIEALTTAWATKDAKDLAYQAALTADQAARTARDVAKTAYEAAKKALDDILGWNSGSALPAVLGIDKKAFPLTTEVVVAARDNATVYGEKAVSVESASITLLGKSQQAGETKTSTVNVATSKVAITTDTLEVTVGDAKITVSGTPAKITLEISGGPQVILDKTTLTLSAGGSGTIKMTASNMSATSDGPLKLSGATVSLG